MNDPTLPFGPRASATPAPESTAPPPAETPDRGPAVGGRWGRFTIERVLGEGGMGRVLLAYDPSLRRQVALKVLRGDDPEWIERFQAEARAQARVEHEHICRVYEVGEVSGRPYIAMQYIAGPTLRTPPAGLSVEGKVRLMVQVAEAVHAAHRTGLIHRDLKPGNILLDRTEDGEFRPFVSDFGIARSTEEPGLTRTGAFLGTLDYMPPEIVLGETQQPDRRVDVWGLGTTLYQLLSGSVPFSGRNEAEVVIRLASGEPTPLDRACPGLPRDLVTIVMKSLERSPDRRYESARAFAEDLQRFLDGEPILARPAPWLERAVKRIRKNRTVATVTSVAALLVLVLGAVAWRTRWQAGRQAELAQEFGREVQAIESQLRIAQMLPLHDTTGEREAVRARMARIEESMRTGGRAALGPGHLALGRGHLALQELAAARRNLEAAWEAGYRSPEVSLALGQALGGLYHQELEHARQQSDRTQQEAQEQRARRELRDPALQYLRGASATTGSQRALVLESLIEFYDERFESALEKAREASRKEPSLYEALSLAGEIDLVSAQRGLARGAYEETERHLEASRQSFEAALAIARSDANLLQRECARRTLFVEMARLRGTEPPELDRTLEPCEQALVAQPNLAAAYETMIRAHWQLGSWRFDRGQDPRELVRRGTELARRAMSVQPEDPYAAIAAGIAEVIGAEYELHHGLDPGPALERAIALLHEAAERAPGFSGVQNELGLAYWTRAQWSANQGQDPRPDHERATACFERAIALEPTYANAHHNLGLNIDYLADYELAHGRASEELRARGIASLVHSTELNPRSGLFWVNLGAAHFKTGAAARERGEDPRKSLSAAIEAFQRGVTETPGYAIAWSNLASARGTLSDYEATRGIDPRPALAEAIRTARKALELNPNLALAEGVVGESWLFQARYESATGLDPTRSLAEAESAFRRAGELNRNFSAALAPYLQEIAGLRSKRKRGLT